MKKCVRIAKNGDRTISFRDGDEVNEWVEYNSTMRFGQALFIDGRCIRHGYLTKKECDEIEKLLQEETEKENK